MYIPCDKPQFGHVWSVDCLLNMCVCGRVCVCMYAHLFVLYGCVCVCAVYRYRSVCVWYGCVYMSVLSVYVVNGFIGNASSATITYSTGANLVQKVEERLVGHGMGWELAKMPPSLLLQKLLTSTARNL